MQRTFFKAILFTTTILFVGLPAKADLKNDLQRTYGPAKAIVANMQNDKNEYPKQYRKSMSNAYENKLDNSLSALQESTNEITSLIQKVRKGVNYAAWGDVAGDNAELLIQIASWASEYKTKTGAPLLSSISERVRRDLLTELERILPKLDPIAEDEWVQEATFAIESLKESLGITSTKLVRYRSRR